MTERRIDSEFLIIGFRNPFGHLLDTEPEIIHNYISDNIIMYYL